MADPDPHGQAMHAAEAACLQAGARLTRLRRNVFAILLAAERPLTAYEILEKLRPADRAATPAGVYRSLDFLTEHRLAHRIESSKAFVACVFPEHAHPSQMLVCRRCGTAVETEDSRVAEAAEDLGRRLGFALDRGALELTGLCPSCRR
jgi:Fur family transcriptional regulator, zinc uptake regulator